MPELEQYLQQKVGSGQYANARDVLCAALPEKIAREVIDSIAGRTRTGAARLRSRVWAKNRSLPVDLDGGTDRRPVVNPPGGFGRQIDAAVAHRLAEVVVPVGAVQRVATGVEVHHIG